VGDLTRRSSVDWNDWLHRWDRFQETYTPSREEQLAVVVDYVAGARRRESVRLLDLCTGPGAVAIRALRRVPGVQVVAVDRDPWLLALGKHASEGTPAVDWLEEDVRDDSWTASHLSGDFDAVAFIGALEWLDDDELRAVYRKVHDLLRVGGVFLIGGVIPSGDATVARIGHQALDRWRAHRIATGEGEHWADFWRAVREEPSFEELVARRGRVMPARRARVAPPLRFHETALAASGFSHVGEVWRVHASAVVIAIR
jgi:SAM-dependent methyltransferase